jgi:EAL domain-containing protein (putative c-di-GMP-specific phosphodiesterase class I)
VASQDHRVTVGRIEQVLGDPDLISMDFQPILDVRAARTAGWEVLARFGDRATDPPPDQWFATAYQVGLGARLEAITVRRAMSALRMRAPGTFISLNVTPSALGDPRIEELFADSAPLTGLVIELTEHASPPHPGPWLAACHRLHNLGATLAIDDIGKGYAEMLQILELRPQIIKIDKDVVQPVEDDPARQAMLRFLGVFADQLDAWLLAEGVETPGQLRVLQGLGVPLAQGWLVGTPDSVPRPCRPEVTRCPPAPSSGPAGVPAARTTPMPTPSTVGDVMRPMAGRGTWAADALRVPVGLPLAEAARRAMTRGPDRRFNPVQCLDAGSSVVGELTVPDLVLALVELTGSGRAAPSPGRAAPSPGRAAPSPG